MKLGWSKFILIVWLFVISVSSVPSILEGDIFHVIDNVQTVHLTSDSETPQIAFVFDVKRSCKIINARVYYKFSHSIKQTYKNFDFYYQLKDSNHKTAIIDLPIPVYRNMTEIYIMSECHPLWLTASKVYG